MPLLARQQPDRFHAEILQYLRAEADLAPLLHPRCLAAGCLFHRRGDADGTFAQIDDDAAFGVLDALQGTRHAAMRRIEDIGDGVLLLQADGDVRTGADIAIDHGDVMSGVEGRRIDQRARRADRRLDLAFAHARDQGFALLAIGDEVVDGDDQKLVLLGEGQDVRQALHGAVVIDQFGDEADRRQAGKARHIDRGLGMARADQHATLAGDQRKDMAGPHEILGADIGVGERPDAGATFLRRDAGGEVLGIVDRDGKGGGVRGGVVGHHGRQMQAAGIGAGQRGAKDTAGMSDEESHMLWRCFGGSHDEIALVLAVLVIHHDHGLARGDGGNGIFDLV